MTDEPRCACGRVADARCTAEDKSNGRICNEPVCFTCWNPKRRRARSDEPEDLGEPRCRGCQGDEPDGWLD